MRSRAWGSKEISVGLYVPLLGLTPIKWSQLIPRASPVEEVAPNATGWGAPCRKFVSISDSASSGRIVDPWRSMGLFDTFTSWKTHAGLTNGGHQEELRAWFELQG